jgi:hypothetical protein
MRRKMDCIHRLYLNAQDFIVDEEELSARIEKVFGTADNPICWNNVPGQMSVRGIGPPEGSSSLAHVFGPQSQQAGLPSIIIQEQKELKRRIVKIAGELAGGKVELPGGLKDSHPDDKF